MYIPDKNQYGVMLSKVKLLPTRRFVQPIPPKQWGHWECEINSRTTELLVQLGFKIIPLKSVEQERERVLPVLPTEHLSYPAPDVPACARSYQIEGIQLMKYFNYKVILADDMGTGKTFQSLMAVKNGSLTPVLILCPASLKINWYKEIKLWNRHKPKIHTLEGRTGNSIPKGTEYLICNYDILYWNVALILESFKPKTVIADEAHVLKTDYKHVGKWYPDYVIKKNEEIIDKKVYSLPPKVVQAVRHIVLPSEKWKGISNVLLLTGTPVQNNAGDLFNLLNLLDPLKFQNRNKFEDYFCNKEAGFRPGSVKISGSKNMDILHKLLLENYMIRRTKQEVLPELPKTQKILLPMPLESKLQKEYNKAKEDIVQWVLENKRKNIITTEQERTARFQTLLQIARYGKLDSVFKHLDNVIDNTKEKYIIFAYHKEIIDAIYDRYKKTSVRIYGSTSGKERDKAVVSFQEDKKTRVFVGQLDSASVGITLTASSNVFFVELGWKAHIIAQATDRSNRLGQKSDSVNAYFFIANNTIEELVMKKIDSKLQTMNNVIDGVDTEEEDLLTYLYDNITENY